mmetsp:Transcript_11498/g.17408  ORF Transcript_11498/g.17408 Transcript_11498/m.17408 type:complete len:225 (+) Transcript_11498:625-1299(+)
MPTVHVSLIRMLLVLILILVIISVPKEIAAATNMNTQPGLRHHPSLAHWHPTIPTPTPLLLLLLPLPPTPIKKYKCRYHPTNRTTLTTTKHYPHPNDRKYSPNKNPPSTPNYHHPSPSNPHHQTISRPTYPRTHSPHHGLSSPHFPMDFVLRHRRPMVKYPPLESFPIADPGSKWMKQIAVLVLVLVLVPERVPQPLFILVSLSAEVAEVAAATAAAAMILLLL